LSYFSRSWKFTTLLILLFGVSALLFPSARAQFGDLPPPPFPGNPFFAIDEVISDGSSILVTWTLGDKGGLIGGTRSVAFFPTLNGNLGTGQGGIQGLRALHKNLDGNLVYPWTTWKDGSCNANVTDQSQYGTGSQYQTRFTSLWDANTQSFESADDLVPSDRLYVTIFDGIVFGSPCNLEGDAPFFTDPEPYVIEVSGPVVSNLNQLRSNAITAINEGGITAETVVVFRGVPLGPAGEQVKLQVELRKFPEPFTGVFDGGILESSFVLFGDVASITRSGLLDGAYHWRARVVDTNSNASDWNEFGDGGNVDFFIKPTPASNPYIYIDGVTSDGSTLSVQWTLLTKGTLASGNQVIAFFPTLNGNLGTGQGGIQGLRALHKNLDGNPSYPSTTWRSGGICNLNVTDQSFYTPGIQYETHFSSIWDVAEATLKDINSLTPADRMRVTVFNGVVSGSPCNFEGDAPFFSDPESYEITLPIKEPVIIIPGIMGSRLNRVSDGEEVWPNIQEMATPLNNKDSYLNELQLSSNGQEVVAQEMNPLDIIEEESILGFNQIFYGNLVNDFRNEGYVDDVDLLLIPYDWRLDISENVIKLKEVIDDALSKSFTGKVNIIAHSMGGVLVKEYLKQFPGMSNDINKLVFAGVPQLGSPKAFKALNYGDNMGFEIGPIDILNPERIKIISQNMPGVYQLLPSRKYVDLAGGYVKDFRNSGKILSYDETEIFMTTDPDLPDYRNSTLLDLADNFHVSQDNQAISVSNIYNIVGCQNAETIGSIRLYPDNEIDITPVDGDGTVPFISAMNDAGSFNNYFALYSEIKANHTGLIKNENLVGLIADIVEGNPIVLPAGVSRFSADCFAELPDPTQVIFSTHSPVELHVYDSSGNHTGPLSNGDIELGIPGSNYYKIGENSFVFVPAGDTYRVEVVATDLGDFDLKIKGYHGSALGEVVTYLDIPINNSNAVAELTFTGFDGPLSLNVDEDGSGDFNKTFEPNAILLGSETEDITPPEINITSPEPVEYIQSELIPISYTIIDTDSGVAFSKVRLDGEEFALSDIDLFFQVLGGHTLSVTAYDKAGNPGVRSVTFNVVTTLSNIISNLDRSFEIGWIPRRSIYNNLLNYLEKADRISQKVVDLEEDVLERPQLERRLEKERKKYQSALEDFIKNLERQYNRGYISKEAFDLLREGTQWLLDNL
jgi:hypothetical protein